MLAPVILFVYNRLDHTKNVLDSLAKNFLAALYDGDNLSKEELQELEDYISEKRKEQQRS